jgi:hypothetical protein
MNDWTKLLIAGGVGYAAAIAYKNYQAESAHEQARLAQSQRGQAGRLTDLALQASREVGLVPAVNGMAGMNGHMSMPPQAANSFRGQAMRTQQMPPHASNGFYGQAGMRQSGNGNPHAPVIVPTRQRTTPPPPPPPPPPADNGNGDGGEYEQYGNGSTMGGQRF